MVKEDYKFGLKQNVNLSKKGERKKRERVKVNCPFIWTKKILLYSFINTGIFLKKTFETPKLEKFQIWEISNVNRTPRSTICELQYCFVTFYKTLCLLRIQVQSRNNIHSTFLCFGLWIFFLFFRFFIYSIWHVYI